MGAAGPRKDLGLAPLRLQELTRRPGLSALGIALEVPQRSWTSDQTRGPTASPHIWSHFFFFEGGRRLRRRTDRSPAQSLFSPYLLRRGGGSSAGLWDPLPVLCGTGARCGSRLPGPVGSAPRLTHSPGTPRRVSRVISSNIALGPPPSLASLWSSWRPKDVVVLILSAGRGGRPGLAASRLAASRRGTASFYRTEDATPHLVPFRADFRGQE